MQDFLAIDGFPPCKISHERNVLKNVTFHYGLQSETNILHLAILFTF